MKWPLLPLLPLLLILSTRAAAHDLRHTVTQDGAIVVEFFYPDETPFSYEQYEIYRPGEDVPFQVGRSDALGRIAFVPDRAGDWKVKAFSEDGHGLEVTVAGGDGNRAAETRRPLIERYARLFAGLGLILGAFGVWSLFMRRKG